MKKWIWLGVAVIGVFVAYNRNRLYIRDPLGSVMRNGAKEAGAQVYINFSNDVLMENDNQPSYILLVQHAGHVGSPVELHCLHWLLCMTDADSATLMQPPPSITAEEMSSKSLRFVETGKQETVVALR